MNSLILRFLRISPLFLLVLLPIWGFVLMLGQSFALLPEFLRMPVLTFSSLYGISSALLTMALFFLTVLPIALFSALYFHYFCRFAFLRSAFKGTMQFLQSLPEIILPIFGVSVFLVFFHLKVISLFIFVLNASIIIFPLMFCTLSRHLSAFTSLAMSKSAKFKTKPDIKQILSLVLPELMSRASPDLTRIFLFASSIVAPVLALTDLSVDSGLPHGFSSKTSNMVAQLYAWLQNAKTAEFAPIMLSLITLFNIIFYILVSTLETKHKSKYGVTEHNEIF